MRVLLVCKGDSSRRSTWSGVPFLIARGLRSCGHEVVPFNVFDDFGFHAAGAVWNRLHGWRRREFETTRIGGWLLWRAVRARLGEGGGFDRVVALTFALDAAGLGVPVELIHDWTHGYAGGFEDAAERRVLGRMRHAERVKCLYAESTRYLRSHGVDAEFVGLPVDVPDGAVASRKDNRAVVFAASNHRDNLDALLEEPELAAGFDAIDVIGCARDGRFGGRFVFHGYLNKDDAEDRARYWGILSRASTCIAMGRRWPGGSSIAEAKACGCRIVTRDWPDLRESRHWTCEIG